MGFNTSVLVLNDALKHIGEDKYFGNTLANAIDKLSVSDGRWIDVPSGNHVNAATVIETHHMNEISLVAFGENCGVNLGVFYPYGNEKDFDVKMLRALADKLGYRVSKKPVKKQ